MALEGSGRTERRRTCSMSILATWSSTVPATERPNSGRSACDWPRRRSTRRSSNTIHTLRPMTNTQHSNVKHCAPQDSRRVRRVASPGREAGGLGLAVGEVDLGGDACAPVFVVEVHRDRHGAGVHEGLGLGLVKGPRLHPFNRRVGVEPAVAACSRWAPFNARARPRTARDGRPASASVGARRGGRQAAVFPDPTTPNITAPGERSRAEIRRQSGAGPAVSVTGEYPTPLTMAGRSAVGESGHVERRARSPRPTPIRATQIRDVLMRNCPARNTARPGTTSYQATTAR